MGTDDRRKKLRSAETYGELDSSIPVLRGCGPDARLSGADLDVLVGSSGARVTRESH